MESPLTETPIIESKWRELAENRCKEANARLTPARWAVYAELVASDRPLSAYELIAREEAKQGRKIAPLTVYRHLDFLMDVGLVHKIESTHKYVPCGHPDHRHESQYLLCSECGRADELESVTLNEVLNDMALERGFQRSKSVVEVTGLCGDCVQQKPL